MAYTQILRALHRHLPQTATLCAVQTCRLARVSLLVHTHRPLSTGWFGPSSQRRLGADAAAALSCLTRAQGRRRLSLDVTVRNKSSPGDRDRSVSRYQAGSPRPSAAQKVKDAGRDFTYLIVVLIGLGVTGGLLYVVFQELFSTSSPNKIYGKAFDKVKSYPEVIGAFGEPIKCYGETTRRGRRQQVRVVIIFIIIKIFFYVCWYRSRQRQLSAYLSNPRNAQIVIVGGRAYLHQMCERQSQTSVWPSWYGVQDELSIEEPSTALPPAVSVSHLDMPPPYEAVSGEDNLKPPPYSECALGDEADAPCPSHCTPLISDEGDSSSMNEAPPPYTASAITQVCVQEGPVSHSESESASSQTAEAASQPGMRIKAPRI
ncbi:putative mitochondrial import inner membrane translocase subunit Tim21 [Scophthalmus maximus]|uniref:Mitochondrial import inner membrane translocase subunit Tim21 n=1 Tax=Scophthalmus maximus TaxID=52904 RepID=A0A2U9CVM2_SCOMX|nr:putative mitochondrial import inner membrane translocase subunit Tim21 [Scophthalmus maximus]